MATPVLAVIAYFVLVKPIPTVNVAEVSETTEKTENSPKKRSKKDSWSRSPANYDSGSSYNRSGVTQQPSMDDGYPTVIETHQDEQNYPDPEKEADQVAEINEQEAKSENSLVDQPNRDPAQSGGDSLDATMNNETEMPNPAVDQPVVEEASDF